MKIFDEKMTIFGEKIKIFEFFSENMVIFDEKS
mgnify:CR=1 FL=1